MQSPRCGTETVCKYFFRGYFYSEVFSAGFSSTIVPWNMYFRRLLATTQQKMLQANCRSFVSIAGIWSTCSTCSCARTEDIQKRFCILILSSFSLFLFSSGCSLAYGRLVPLPTDLYSFGNYSMTSGPVLCLVNFLFLYQIAVVMLFMSTGAQTLQEIQ